MNEGNYRKKWSVSTNLEPVRIAGVEANLDGGPVALVDVGKRRDVQKSLVVFDTVNTSGRQSYVRVWRQHR